MNCSFWIGTKYHSSKNKTFALCVQSSALNIYAMAGASSLLVQKWTLSCSLAEHKNDLITMNYPTHHTCSIFLTQTLRHSFLPPENWGSFQNGAPSAILRLLSVSCQCPPLTVCLLHACAPFKAKESPTLFTMTFSTKHVWHCVNRNTASLRVVPHAYKYLHGTEDVWLPFNSWLKHMVASN